MRRDGWGNGGHHELKNGGSDASVFVLAAGTGKPKPAGAGAKTPDDIMTVDLDSRTFVWG
jgi:hypothetical protein